VQDFSPSKDAIRGVARLAPPGSEALVKQGQEHVRYLFQEPGRRFCSDELLSLARDYDPRFSKRLLHDWPVWGLLAPATPEGRGPKGGVCWTWSAREVDAFLAVVRYRARGHRRRSDLANIPISRWLVFSEEGVPLEQVRRALATWARASGRLSKRRVRTDTYHHALRYREVQERLTLGSQTKFDLSKASSAAPSGRNAEELAAFTARLSGPLNPTPIEDTERVATHQRALRARELGIRALPHVQDVALDQARTSYRDCTQDLLDALKAPLSESEADAVALRFKTEGETACANALTHLGAVLSDARIAEALDVGARASLELSTLFARVAFAQRTHHSGINRAQQRRASRMHKRHR
jgi:hypothetical protein